MEKTQQQVLWDLEKFHDQIRFSVYDLDSEEWRQYIKELYLLLFKELGSLRFKEVTIQTTLLNDEVREFEICRVTGSGNLLRTKYEFNFTLDPSLVVNRKDSLLDRIVLNASSLNSIKQFFML